MSVAVAVEPDAVPTLQYCAAPTVPVAVYVHTSPGSNKPFPFESPPENTGLKSSSVTAAVPLSSVTVTFANGTVPGFVTTYVHVTDAPGVNTGPSAGRSASRPFTNFTIAITGAPSTR